MSDDLLATVEKALAKATPGPWHMQTNFDLNIGIQIRSASGALIGIDPTREDDAVIVANAPDWLRALVARCREAEAQRDALAGAMSADMADVAVSYAAANTRATTAEASYQEAQLTIAGLEAERDHYRDMPKARDIIHDDSEDVPCMFCNLRDARAEVARLREALTKIAGGLMAYGSDLRAIARAALEGKR